MTKEKGFTTNQSKNLRYFRKHVLKYTQKRLADETNISQGQVYKYESGQNLIPTEYVILMHNKFGMRYEWFNDNEGKPISKEKENRSIVKDFDTLQNNYDLLEARFTVLENNFKKLFRDFYDKEYSGRKAFNTSQKPGV